MVANNAGQPATPADLINVDEVIGKYYDLVPDPSVPEQRVIFGTSGHRGSSLKTSFNEAHIVAISQAIAEYRKKAGVTGPLYLGSDTHALSGPAKKTAIEVLVANGVHVRIDSRDDFVPTPVVSQAILTHNRAADGTQRFEGEGLADGIVVTPSHNPPTDGGFKYDPVTGGRNHQRHRRPRQRAACRLQERQARAVRGGHQVRVRRGLRLPRALRGRPGERHRL